MPSDLLLIHGDERHLVDSELRDWRIRVCGPGVEVEIFESPAKLAMLRQSLTDVPLFEPARAVIVRDPPQLSERARKGADSAEDLAAMLVDRAPTTAVCLVVHSTVAASNPVLSSIARLAGKVAFRPSLRGRDLRSWVDTEVSRRSLRLPRGAVEHLIAVSGGDLGIVSGDLDKLQAFAGGQPMALEQIQALCGGNEQLEVWNILERLLGKAPAEGVIAVDALLEESRSSQYLITTLAGQIRDIALARALAEEEKRNPAALAQAMGIPPWRAERLARQALRVSGELADSWLRELHQLDAGIKAGERNDVDGLRLFIRRAAADLTAA